MYSISLGRNYIHNAVYVLSEIVDARKRRRRSGSLVLQKRRRRLLPFIPTEDSTQRLKQMGSLASALTTLQMKFSDDLTYMPGMAPKSANQSKLEDGGMQVEYMFLFFGRSSRIMS